MIRSSLRCFAFTALLVACAGGCKSRTLEPTPEQVQKIEASLAANYELATSAGQAASTSAPASAPAAPPAHLVLAPDLTFDLAGLSPADGSGLDAPGDRALSIRGTWAANDDGGGKWAVILSVAHVNDRAVDKKVYAHPQGLVGSANLYVDWGEGNQTSHFKWLGKLPATSQPVK